MPDSSRYVFFDDNILHSRLLYFEYFSICWWCSAESVRVWTFFSHCGNLNLSCGSFDVMKHGFGLFMLRVKDVYTPLL